MEVLAHYSPEDVSITFGGYTVRGFMDGQFIVIRRQELIYKTKASADGKVVRSASGDRLYEVRFYLHSGSESNLDLNLIRDIDAATHMGVIPLMVKDNLGSTLFFSPSAWVEGEPTVSMGVQVEEREWIIRCTEATMVVGGNFKPSSKSSDLFRGLRGGLSNFI